MQMDQEHQILIADKENNILQNICEKYFESRFITTFSSLKNILNEKQIERLSGKYYEQCHKNVQ